MTLKEAIESGKPFRRKGESDWANQEEFWTTDEVLSEDWELKPEPREWEVYVNEHWTISMQPFNESKYTWKRIVVREVE